MTDRPASALLWVLTPARWTAVLLGLALLFALTSCGMFNASGQIGPDLKPRFGTSVSVPLGK